MHTHTRAVFKGGQGGQSPPLKLPQRNIYIMMYISIINNLQLHHDRRKIEFNSYIGSYAIFRSVMFPECVTCRMYCQIIHQARTCDSVCYFGCTYSAVGGLKWASNIRGRPGPRPGTFSAAAAAWAAFAMQNIYSCGRGQGRFRPGTRTRPQYYPISDRDCNIDHNFRLL